MGPLDAQSTTPHAAAKPSSIPRVRELMSTGNLITIGPEDDLGLAMQAMLWSGVRHLPVVADEQIVGVLGERDILAQRAAAGRRQADQLPVRAAMSARPLVVAPDATLADAAATMLASGTDFLPVVEGGGHLVGVIDTTDVLRHEASRASSAPQPVGLTACDVMTPRPVTVRPH